MTKKLHPIKYEELKWEKSDNLQYLSRKNRSKILPTYLSAIPDTIFDKNMMLPADLDAAISDLLVHLSRFDEIQHQKGYAFPSMLLRSESAASSHIENLTSSIRNIALAELDSKSPQNAQLIAGNVAAMRKALTIEETISISSILSIHSSLMSPMDKDIAGNFREEPVWIGGTTYSPHGAIFVPPHQSRIKFYLEDLVAYSNRIDVNPIVKAAILHAQFETIHPFVDGNGRTGRTLLHKSLKDDGVLKTVALPISAGLLNNTNDYMEAILLFQKGNPLPIIEQIFEAIELAVNIGNTVSNEISIIIKQWESIIVERKTASIWRLIYLLIDQPVVNSKYLAEHLEITLRGANKLIDTAIEYGILRQIGTNQRGIFYQADQIIEVLDKIAGSEDIRRYFG